MALLLIGGEGARKYYSWMYRRDSSLFMFVEREGESQEFSISMQVIGVILLFLSLKIMLVLVVIDCRVCFNDCYSYSSRDLSKNIENF